jgi:hypothetical protein
MTYNGTVFWGFTADYDLVPDLEYFVDLIERSFAELAALAGIDVPSSPGSDSSPKSRLLPPAERD